MGTQQTVLVEGVDRDLGLLAEGSFEHAKSGGLAVRAERGLGLGLAGDLDELDLVGRRPEHVEHPVGVSHAERLRERLDVLGAPEVLGERLDWRLRAGAVALDQVAEHRAGADGGQLLGIADQHEPGLRPQRLEQPAHHGQLDHR